MGFHCIAAIGRRIWPLSQAQVLSLCPSLRTLRGMQPVLPNHNIAFRLLPAKRV